MKKVIHPFDRSFYGEGKKYPVFFKIKFEDGKLSITGVESPLPSGNCRGGCGQIDMEYEHRKPEHNDKRYDQPIKASSLRFSKGWDSENWLQFLEYWHLWHLNDMHSECEHQESLGWKYETHRGQKCPECGYEIGTARTRREVPQEVIDFLFSVPDTDKIPAWV